MTKQITFRAPTDALFAAVQVEAFDGEDWRIVGAQPAFTYDEETDTMHPLAEVAVDCKLEPGDQRLLCKWLHENSQLGVVETEQAVEPEHGRRRRLGGPR